jgi:hypothetical protein
LEYRLGIGVRYAVEYELKSMVFVYASTHPLFRLRGHKHGK